VVGALDLDWPTNAIRPIVIEPPKRRVEAPNGNVRTSAERREFFAVVEYSRTDRSVLDAEAGLVCVRYGKKVCDLLHTFLSVILPLPSTVFLPLE